MTKKHIGCLADKKTQAVEVEATNCTNHRTTENKRQKKWEKFTMSEQDEEELSVNLTEQFQA